MAVLPSVASIPFFGDLVPASSGFAIPHLDKDMKGHLNGERMWAVGGTVSKAGLLKGAYSYDAISEIRNRLVFIVSVLTILPWVLFTLRIEEEECAAEKEAKHGERGQLINPSKACRVEVIVQVEK